MAGKLYRDVLVKLTPEEWQDRASALAVEVKTIQEMDEEKLDFSRLWRKRAVRVRSEIRRLRTQVTSNEEMRAVECYEKPDVEKPRILIYRKDTDELVGERDLTTTERYIRDNPSLPGVNPGGRLVALDGGKSEDDGGLRPPELLKRFGFGDVLEEVSKLKGDALRARYESLHKEPPEKGMKKKDVVDAILTKEWEQRQPRIPPPSPVKAAKDGEPTPIGAAVKRVIERVIPPEEPLDENF